MLSPRKTSVSPSLSSICLSVGLKVAGSTGAGAGFWANATGLNAMSAAPTVRRRLERRANGFMERIVQSGAWLARARVGTGSWRVAQASYSFSYSYSYSVARRVRVIRNDAVERRTRLKRRDAENEEMRRGEAGKSTPKGELEFIRHTLRSSAISASLR